VVLPARTPGLLIGFLGFDARSAHLYAPPTASELRPQQHRQASPQPGSYPASCSLPRGPAVGHQPRATRCVSCHGRSAAAKSGGLLAQANQGGQRAEIYIDLNEHNRVFVTSQPQGTPSVLAESIPDVRVALLCGDREIYIEGGSWNWTLHVAFAVADDLSCTASTTKARRQRDNLIGKIGELT